MNSPVDFQKLRQKRQRTRRIKQLLVLVVIVLLIFSALYINDLMVRKNLTLRISDLIGSVGGGGFPAELPSGSVRHVDNVGTNLIILKDSNMYVYNKKGKLTENVQQMSERTVITTDKERILQYDTGGRKATLYSSNTLLHTFELEDNIISAQIGDSGQVAIVTSPSKSVAEINVYNAKFDLFYNRTSPDKLISDVAISTKGKTLAAATFGTNGGVLEFQVLIFPLDKKEESASITMSDKVIIKMKYLNEETLSILTNKDYLIYDINGTLVSSYIFPENFTLQEYRERNGQILLLSRDEETREFALTLLNPQGGELASVSFENRPLDINIGDKYIHILASDRVVELNYAFNLQGEYLLQGVERIRSVEDRVYLIAKTEVRILDKDIKQTD